MDTQTQQIVAFWVINGMSAAGLVGLVWTGALREKILAEGPTRDLGLSTLVYALGAALVMKYTILMLVLGGLGSQAGGIILTLMPFVLIGLMIGTLMQRPDGLSRVGLIPKRPGSDILWAISAALIGTAFAASAGYGINALLTALDMAPPQVVHDTLQQLRDEYSVELLVTVIVSAVILAPLFEELIFRGLLQTSLLHLLGGRRWVTLLITALIFSITHWWVVSWHGLVPLFVIGLVFGYVYERTGSLLTPILCHALFNGINIAIAVATMPMPVAD